MALATQCPHCYTSFRVANDQLKLYAGLVRCGTCQQTFNGIDHLLSPGQAPRVRPDANETVTTAESFDAISPTNIEHTSTSMASDIATDIATDIAPDPAIDSTIEPVIDAVANAVVDTAAEVEVMEEQLQALIQDQSEPLIESTPTSNATTDHSTLDPLYAKYFESSANIEENIDTDKIEVTKLTSQAEEIIAQEYVELAPETNDEAHIEKELEPDLNVNAESELELTTPAQETKNEAIALVSDITIENATNMMAESAQLFDSINASDASNTNSAEPSTTSTIQTVSTNEINAHSSLEFEEPTFYLGDDLATEELNSDAPMHQSEEVATHQESTSEQTEIQDDDAEFFIDEQLQQVNTVNEVSIENAIDVESEISIQESKVTDTEDIKETEETEEAEEPIDQAKDASEGELEEVNETEEVATDNSNKIDELHHDLSNVDNEQGSDENSDATSDDHAEEIKPQFVLQAEKKQRYGKWFTAMYSLLILLLIISALGQLSYHFRDQLYAHFPASRTPLLKACKLLNCQMHLLAEKGAVTKESQELVLLSSNPQILTLSVQLQNRSNTVQAWPMIELVLMDSRKKPLLQRVFTPQEYLDNKKEAGLGIGASSEKNVDINFELGIPKAASYEVKLFYP